MRFTVVPSMVDGWFVVLDNEQSVAVTARGGKAIRPSQTEAETIADRLERQAVRESRKKVTA